jgi:hypothetical protein
VTVRSADPRSRQLAEKIYSLLPALYRIRDAELSRRQGGSDDDGPLRGLIAVIAEQAAVLEEDLEQLYDDQFIETCSEWVVPYIGDLVAARGLFVFKSARFSQRALVANTLSNRRRKGTAAGLEQLARDVTNWDASVVEYFQRLVTTQYMKHVRCDNHLMPELRRSAALDDLNTPFDAVARLLEVRRIASRRGKYNIPNVGVFLWRLSANRITSAPAFRVDQHRYLFDALGRTVPLFTRAVSEPDISHLATPLNVPAPITRRRLARALSDYYGAEEPKSLHITLNGVPVPTEQVRVCNLSDPPEDADASPPAATGWWRDPGAEYLVDPELGRLIAPASTGLADVVRVTYHYGFSAEMGSGEYARASSFSTNLEPVVTILAPASVQDGLNNLHGHGAVAIDDSDYHAEALVIDAAAGGQIELRAADRRRPVLLLDGELLVSGGDESAVTLNGLLVSAGAVRVPRFASAGRPNGLRVLKLRHCTLAPGASPEFVLPGGISVPPQPAGPRLLIEAPDVTVEIEDCIVGPIRAVDGAHVRIANSIVDAQGDSEIAFAGVSELSPPDASSEAGATLEVVNSTVIGKVHTHTMRLASNAIFRGRVRPLDTWSAPVIAERLQEGCVRYCYAPPGSRLPRLYRCQPEAPVDAARVRPVFTSLRFGDPGYGQLSLLTAVEVRTGADDQAEMGAFHDLYQPQRVSNLRTRIDEYLRFGLEAGILFAS